MAVEKSERLRTDDGFLAMQVIAGAHQDASSATPTECEGDREAVRYGSDRRLPEGEVASELQGRGARVDHQGLARCDQFRRVTPNALSFGPVLRQALSKVGASARERRNSAMRTGETTFRLKRLHIAADGFGADVEAGGEVRRPDVGRKPQLAQDAVPAGTLLETGQDTLPRLRGHFHIFHPSRCNSPQRVIVSEQALAPRGAAHGRRTHMFERILKAPALAALLVAVPGSLMAQDCANQGDLDQMYCDADGDMVADAPTDEGALQDPGTLVFAYTPVEDPAIYEDIWEPFIAHLEEVTGKDVQFFAVQSNSAEVEAMRSGRLHIAGFSTGPTPYAVNLAGAVPFAIMGSDDGSFGYTLQVYTRADSDIQEMTDLAGRRIAHTSPTSNSGNLAPRALFPGLGVTPDEDYEVIYSGSHDQSMLGVVAGDYDAAPVASEVVDRMAERGLYDPAEVRIVWESDRFPTTSYTYAHDLTPELKANIEEAFFSFDFAGTALGEEFEGVSKFVPITYEENWSVIRDIQEANGVEYTPEGLAAE